MKPNDYLIGTYTGNDWTALRIALANLWNCRLTPTLTATQVAVRSREKLSKTDYAWLLGWYSGWISRENS